MSGKELQARNFPDSGRQGGDGREADACIQEVSSDCLLLLVHSSQTRTLLGVQCDGGSMCRPLRSSVVSSYTMMPYNSTISTIDKSSLLALDYKNCWQRRLRELGRELTVGLVEVFHSKSERTFRGRPEALHRRQQLAFRMYRGCFD
jgi:hypothetical protein